MSLSACRYAVVQFLPYAETGEFANVGIVLLCPEARYFAYRLQPARRTRRITTFFERLHRADYVRALRLFQQELGRVGALLNGDIFPRGDAEAARQIFTALTHPREAVVRFSPVRAVMALRPEQALDELFGRYVEHDFATREYREEVLEKRIGQMLRSLTLPRPFQPQVIGNDETHARFPFVQMENDRPVKAIKPIYLAQSEPHRIFEHADHWLPKMRRLRARGLLPPQVLLSVEAPPEQAALRFRAFAEVRDEMTDLGLVTVSANDDAAIKSFAVATVGQ